MSAPYLRNSGCGLTPAHQSQPLGRGDTNPLTKKKAAHTRGIFLGGFGPDDNRWRNSWAMSENSDTPNVPRKAGNKHKGSPPGDPTASSSAQAKTRTRFGADTHCAMKFALPCEGNAATGLLHTLSFKRRSPRWCIRTVICKLSVPRSVGASEEPSARCGSRPRTCHRGCSRSVERGRSRRQVRAPSPLNFCPRPEGQDNDAPLE